MAEEQKTETQTTTESKGSEETTVTISQEKLDSLINEKFKKGAEKANAKILETLGVESLDDVKSIIDAKKEAEEAQKTELQKLQEQLEAEKNMRVELEGKLNATLTETEIQNLAMSNGISPDKVKYFKMDYLDAKKDENFDLDGFIGGLKESQPDFFVVENRTPQNVPNPPSRGASTTQIKMSDYAQLSAEERKKYKSSDIIR